VIIAHPDEKLTCAAGHPVATVRRLLCDDRPRPRPGDFWCYDARLSAVSEDSGLYCPECAAPVFFDPARAERALYINGERRL
jgi:hypothetical protein